MKPYTPVPDHVMERLEIAILCGEKMNLQWADEATHRAYASKVQAKELFDNEGRAYLRAITEEGEEVTVRLDLIRNLPTPVK